MSDDSEYENRNFWDYEICPFTGDVILEGEEYREWKRTNDRISAYYANQPPDRGEDDEF